MNRRSTVLAAMICLGATASLADDERARRLEQLEAESRHYWRLEDRARQLMPRRRDTPMRVQNITDEEVSEIQATAREIVPRSIINIGAVTSGCPCEDGPGCTDQVWIVATDQSRTTGLLLSRISGAWVVGPVQAWWLRYDEFLRSQRRYSRYLVDEAAQRKLLDVMPFCTAEAGTHTSRAAVLGSGR